jgi:hypothetical protein
MEKTLKINLKILSILVIQEKKTTIWFDQDLVQKKTEVEADTDITTILDLVLKKIEMIVDTGTLIHALDQGREVERPTNDLDQDPDQDLVQEKTEVEADTNTTTILDLVLKKIEMIVDTGTLIHALDQGREVERPTNDLDRDLVQEKTEVEADTNITTILDLVLKKIER